MKMPVELFDSLKVDEVIDAPGMLAGLSTEHLRLRVKDRNADRVDFVVTYFGVTLGNWKAQRAGETITWAL